MPRKEGREASLAVEWALPSKGGRENKVDAESGYEGGKEARMKLVPGDTLKVGFGR